ncbi:MAG: trehalose-phosphatase [Desulfobaccales bacterium]
MDRKIDPLFAVLESLPQDQKLLLLLDYDGTLVEIAPRPELARPPQELLHLLDCLVSLPGLAVVVVSGRGLGDLQDFLPIPGLNYLGSHGAEGLMVGKLWTPKADTGSRAEQEELRRQLTDRLAHVKGWWVETKPLGFALHYRQAGLEEEQKIVGVLKPWLDEVARAGRHQILQGKKVMEILPVGVSKGAAIQDILLFPGFGGHFPVYLGDDLTDESAFQVLQGRGLTVKVGVGQAVTAASYSLPHPKDVRQFLFLLASRLEDRG